MKRIALIFFPFSPKEYIRFLEIEEEIVEEKMKEIVVDWILKSLQWGNSQIVGPLKDIEDETYRLVLRNQKDGKMVEVKFFINPYNKQSREEAVRIVHNLYDDLKQIAKEFIMSPRNDEEIIEKYVDEMIMEAFEANGSFSSNKDGNA